MEIKKKYRVKLLLWSMKFVYLFFHRIAYSHVPTHIVHNMYVPIYTKYTQLNYHNTINTILLYWITSIYLSTFVYLLYPYNNIIAIARTLEGIDVCLT